MLTNVGDRCAGGVGVRGGQAIDDLVDQCLFFFARNHANDANAGQSLDAWGSLAIHAGFAFCLFPLGFLHASTPGRWWR